MVEPTTDLAIRFPVRYDALEWAIKDAHGEPLFEIAPSLSVSSDYADFVECAVDALNAYPLIERMVEILDALDSSEHGFCAAPEDNPCSICRVLSLYRAEVPHAPPS